MDGFGVLDFENRGARGLGSMKEEGAGKFVSLGRKRLSDITNTQTASFKDEKLRPYSFATKEYIEKIQKENITLRQLLQESTHVIQERNKFIELTTLELSKLRINMQKLQQQNRLLAQANSHMTMERTLDKDRMRVMQHELGCRGALLAAKNMEFQMNQVEEVEVKKKRRQKPCTVKKPEDVTVEATVTDGAGGTANDVSEEINEEHVPDDQGDAKPNRSRGSRTQSSGSAVVKEQVVSKEKAQNKRKSAGVKSEQREPTAVIPINKRSCLRRQSARFNSDSVKPTKDFGEIEDEGNGTSMLLDTNMQDGALKVDKEKADKESDQVDGDHVQAHVGDDEVHKFCRSLRSRTQSLGSLDVKEQLTAKEKPERKRKSTIIKSEERDSIDDQSASERLCSKRQLASSKYEDVEDARFPVGSSMPVLTNSAAEEVKEAKTDWNRDTPGLKTSLGRPSRAAAGKVQSYKEIPVNIKMRRTE